VHPLAGAQPEWADQPAPPEVALGGEADTVFSSAHPAGIGFTVTNGSVARYVFDLAHRDAGGWIVPLGAAGDPRSPHFASQRARWAAGELVPLVTEWAALEAAATMRCVLDPG
jgi:penicillin amidase